MRTIPGRPAAFTIVEVMIAVLIIGASMTPIFFMFSRSSTGTVQSRDEVLAYAYAQEMLEFAQARGFDDPQVAVGENRTITPLELRALGGGAIALPVDPRFTRVLHVRVPPLSAAAWPYQYKVLVAEVSWKPNDEQTRSVRLTGLLTRAK
ncbi:MAG: hypothetical protein OZSIB_4140 [Candidatus Ozemobacter sibiricus]|jgi:type II secretory pathway pseudopilin PulG|uniref:Prepilin-type N-terminal cleavage/methylation domain-containing protein n=1 Tax=Candidatus Ozemobacter sibiricus TaxID=2268124 RepID=A0A367ZNG5_9BACT|nr:MAG: hypothetical protein OZSIB_4140 [Candidatus Ozemobacter sibiricus]